jgi:hypothetical protein
MGAGGAGFRRGCFCYGMRWAAACCECSATYGYDPRAGATTRADEPSGAVVTRRGYPETA